MILPIVAYGHPALKAVSKSIDGKYPGLKEFIGNMWDTMYNGRGIGLAAPQVGVNIRLFVIDSLQLARENEKIEDEDEKYKLTFGIKKVFINPVMITEEGAPWTYEEGCLSIPDIRVKIARREVAQIKYYDENFEEHVEIYDGMNARIIQHEYDHIEGVLLTDHMTPLKKSLIKGKLDNIMKGKIDVKYKMKFKSVK